KVMKKLICALLTIVLTGCQGSTPDRELKPPAAVEDDIAVYFSPKGGAMAAILREIEQARKTIDVQAYLITAKEIVEALQAAQARGVRVRIVLDKRNMGGAYSYTAYLSKTGLPVWRDGQHKDTHDKVMLIDGRTIITGSFNFTDQSEDVNSENVLIIRNKPKLFATYLENFEMHLGHSEPPK